MFISTVFGTFSALLPVFFVMALGLWAGCAGRFDRDQVRGFNELILDYALPAALFVGIVTTPRTVLLASGPFVIALLIAFLGVFILAAAFSRIILRRGLGKAALHGACMVFANVAFIGIPIFSSLFGQSSILSIAIAAMVLNVTLLPLIVSILEYDKQLSCGGKEHSFAGLVGQSLSSSLKKPVVTAPIVAMVLVLLAIPVPKEINSMLNLIGSVTSGLAMFVSGLIISAYRFRVTVEIAVNTLVKMVVQPVFMAGLVVIFGIDKPLGLEAVLLCAFPTAVIPVMLALHYNVYEAEAAATLLLSTAAMVIVIPVAIAFSGA